MIKGDDLRYSRLGDILHIVFQMRGKRNGITLDEIAEELNTTRRTAERIRDAILRNFPCTDEIPSNDKYKRWGFVNWAGHRAFLSGLIGFTENELLTLENMKKQARQKRNSAVEEVLKQLLHKLKALQQESKDGESFYEENLKILIASEGFAVSQFSYQMINCNQLALIREGLKGSRSLIFNYTNRKGSHSERNVEPYGILYNHKNYLVAKDDGVMKLFDLSRIANLVLGKIFDVDRSFNLEELSQHSFGIYQEEPITVVLLFSTYASHDAQQYHFHPSQQLKMRENGQLEVTFKAGGVRSIMWELFKWGTHVHILEPQSLKTAYIDELQKILASQDR